MQYSITQRPSMSTMRGHPAHRFILFGIYKVFKNEAIFLNWEISLKIQILFSLEELANVKHWATHIPHSKSQLELSGDLILSLQTGLRPWVHKKHHYSLSLPNNRHKISSIYYHDTLIFCFQQRSAVPMCLSKERMGNSAQEYLGVDRKTSLCTKCIYLPSLFIHLCCLTPLGI